MSKKQTTSRRTQQRMVLKEQSPGKHKPLSSFYWMVSLMSKVTIVNPNYKDTIDWKTLLTTIVENLRAVSHFKHEIFDALQYATNFGTISKESLKRITKWAGGSGGQNTLHIHLHTIQCHRRECRSRMKGL